MDLVLKHGRHRTGTVVGRLDPRGARRNAIIKLLRTKGSPVSHTAPDAHGFFVFADVRPGRYRLAAAAPGYGPDLTPPFDVPPGRTVERNLALARDPHAADATASGRVLRIGGGPVASAAVALIPSRLHRVPRGFYRITFSIADGEYLLCHVRPGRYTLVAWKRDLAPFVQRIELHRRELLHLDPVLTAGPFDPAGVGPWSAPTDPH